jgi:hypothetical protein
MRIFCFFISITFIYGCKHDPVEAVKTCVLPETVSFSQHIVPLFNAHCNTSGCHSGNQPAGGLNLEPNNAYAQLSQSGSGYIDTINPNYSLLYAQMISVNTPMPPTGTLEKCSTDLVLRWISQKAPNN